MLNKLQNLIRSMVLLFAGVALPGTALAEDLKAATAILVHGAFADGSSWRHVVPKLQEAGLEVTAVQLPLDSLAGDAAVVTRAIDAAEGPVVLVGHSWGGMVITEAGVRDDVHALVYLSAVAPSKGQTFLDVAHEAPDAAGMSALVIDDAGYVTLSGNGFSQFFAQDLPASETAVLAASQGALNTKALNDQATKVAWSERPSYFVITTEDFIVPTELQRMLSNRIAAKPVEIPASHASMLSQPNLVAQTIIQAAK